MSKIPYQLKGKLPERMSRKFSKIYFKEKRNICKWAIKILLKKVDQFKKSKKRNQNDDFKNFCNKRINEYQGYIKFLIELKNNKTLIQNGKREFCNIFEPFFNLCDIKNGYDLLYVNNIIVEKIKIWLK
jgi:hypothetical protein